MTTVSNATPSGLIEVTPGSADTTERLVGDMDVTVAVSGGAVDVTVSLWESMDAFGTVKGAVARVRRDNTSGAILASYTFGDDGDSTGGHSSQWSTSFTDSSATTGRYVVTIQATPNAARVYSDTHSISVTSPSAATILAVPVGAVAVDGLSVTAVASNTIAVPVGTVAVAGLAPSLLITSQLVGYDLDANSSQALQVQVGLSAVLETDPIPVAPPTHWTEAQVRGRRVSLVMPDPTLDSRGRPT